MINPLWLELPLSRTYFKGPRDVRAIEVLLYKEQKLRGEQPQIYKWRYPGNAKIITFPRHQSKKGLSRGTKHDKTNTTNKTIDEQVKKKNTNKKLLATQRINNTRTIALERPVLKLPGMKIDSLYRMFKCKITKNDALINSIVKHYRQCLYEDFI